MARRVFFSFYYIGDCWRTSQVRNIGAIEGNAPITDNDWESIASGGDPAIEKWIADQLKGRSCTVVLVGEKTAGRRWITHEIKESWNARMGVVGICIHNLKHLDGSQCGRGGSPFDHVTLGDEKLSSIVKLYNPPGASSAAVYAHIKDNICDWVEEAISIRGRYYR